jgi:DNA repair protein RadC
MREVKLARLSLEVTETRVVPKGGQGDLIIELGWHKEPVECVWLIANDMAGNVHTVLELSRGNHNAVDVDVAWALTVALTTGASAFSVVHNHPTLSVLPSMSDVNMTRTLLEAANMVGLLLEDHVIVSPKGDQFSFRETGYIGGAERVSTRAAAPRRKKG